MKRTAIFLVLILVLAGGGAAGWWFMLREAPEEMVQETSAEGEDAHRPILVDVDPMTVPVIRDGRVVQHMSFVVALQVDTEEQHRVAYKALRRLTDAYIHELHVLLSRRFVWEEDDIVPFVRKRLLAASAQVVGQEIVQDVLIKGIQSRTPQPT